VAWIESHQSLKNHPKTVMASKTMGISKAQVIGHLHLLWWWCADYAKDGVLEKFSEEQVADAAEWSGDPSDFIEHMANAGFIDRVPLRVHDWGSYRLHYDLLQATRDRKLKQVRRRVKRWRERNADVTQHSNAPVTQCNAPTIKTLKTVHTKQTKPEKIKHLDFVWLTPEEHGKLKTTLGKHLDPFISRLNGYIGQIGEKKAAAKYTSHYHTILNWFRGDIEKGLIRPEFIKPPTPKTPDPKPEDCVSAEDVGQLVKALAGKVKP